MLNNKCLQRFESFSFPCIGTEQPINHRIFMPASHVFLSFSKKAPAFHPFTMCKVKCFLEASAEGYFLISTYMKETIDLEFSSLQVFTQRQPMVLDAEFPLRSAGNSTSLMLYLGFFGSGSLKPNSQIIIIIPFQLEVFFRFLHDYQLVKSVASSVI